MSNFFIDPNKKVRFHLLHSLVYYLSILIIICFLLFGAYYNSNIIHGHISLTQLMIGWAIVTAIFFILIGIYTHHYSYKHYKNESPQEWISSEDSDLFSIPIKFQLPFGRRFLLDAKIFSFEANKKEGYSLGLIFFLLFTGLLLSFYPYLAHISSITPKYMIVISLLIPICIIFFLYFTLIYLVFRITFLEWKFEKASGDVINFFISNPGKKRIQSSTPKHNFSFLKVEEKNLSEIYSKPKLLKRYKGDPKIFVLKIPIPAFISDINNNNETFYLSMSSSREYVELIQKIFLKWLNNIITVN